MVFGLGSTRMPPLTGLEMVFRAGVLDKDVAPPELSPAAQDSATSLHTRIFRRSSRKCSIVATRREVCADARPWAEAHGYSQGLAPRGADRGAIR